MMNLTMILDKERTTGYFQAQCNFRFDFLRFLNIIFLELEDEDHTKDRVMILSTVPHTLTLFVTFL